ncbi:voltage-gated potassium channel [Catalinimonas alkaloidigena]|uniref:Voltage-gated potassium channel n=1 Tax=Catalinimonas alkaloidigena TaxID=1075417 RepID=A0A1G9FDI8_9BACT|nr:potassium channel protein [Catalinimonas alkaloidigena]SDK86464.1 voltage-gated potassium channel [Catalinimonas alkaloidigena]
MLLFISRILESLGRIRWGDLRGLFQAFGLMLVSTCVGITGFIILEGYSLVNAFYMTVITLSTVGYTEVEPLSEKGKIFTSLYILFNLSIFAYFVSIFTAYIMEGKLRNILQQVRNEQELEKMKNHVIVCGLGRNGSKVCEELERSRIPFVMIDNHPALIESELEQQSELLIREDATDDATLHRAGVSRARALITTLPKDADNVFITLSARELNAKLLIISRASDESSISKLRRAGANHVVMPDAIGGLHMANLITKPEVIELLELFNGTVPGAPKKLEEIRSDSLKAEYQGKTLRQLNIRALTGATVLGLKNARDEFEVNPHPDIHIGPQDVLIFFGTTEEIEKTKSTFCR